MSWVFFALLARALWAASNTIDKYVIEKYSRNYLIYLLLIGFSDLVVLLIVPFRGLAILPPLFMLIALTAGALYIWGLLPYFKALTFEETSRIIPIWNLTPIFVLLLSVLTVGEKLGTKDYIAFALLIMGGFLISTKRIEGVFKISKALYLMLLSCFMLAVEAILLKYLYQNVPYLDGFIWVRVGAFLAVFPLLFIPNFRKSLFAMIRLLPNSVKSIVAGNEMLNLGGLVCLEFAISLGSVSLITASAGLQPAILLLYAIILSIWFPKILKEELDKKIILNKIIAILILAVGVYLIST